MKTAVEAGMVLNTTKHSRFQLSVLLVLADLTLFMCTVSFLWNNRLKYFSFVSCAENVAPLCFVQTYCLIGKTRT